MFSVKDILLSLYETFNAETDDKKETIQREMREAYYELCRQTSWLALRDKLTYSYDEAADGMWLPSDVIGIDCVTDGTNIWKESGMTASLDVNSVEKRWFISEIARAPLAFGKGISVADGDTAFTGAPAVIAAHAGEFLKIGGENAFYKIASATTLVTAYRGPKVVSGAYSVRPVGTKKIKLLAEYSETDTTAATIFVWRYPEQLYSEDQLCQLPRADILELATAEKIYGHTKEIELKNSVQKDLYGSKGRYVGKLDMAIADNPEFIPPIIPRNSAGCRAGYGARH